MLYRSTLRRLTARLVSVSLVGCLFTSGCSPATYSLSSGDYDVYISVVGEAAPREPGTVTIDVDGTGKVVVRDKGGNELTGSLNENAIELAGTGTDVTTRFEGRLEADNVVVGTTTQRTAKDGQEHKAKLTMKKR